MIIKKNIYLLPFSLLFLVLLILILLFPPYLVDSKKDFDFIFNSEKKTLRQNIQYTYTVNSQERNLSVIDTIDAINIKTITHSDTIYNFIQLKPLPKIKSSIKASKNILEFDLTPIAEELAQEREYRSNVEYFRKEIDTIKHYTITEITKPYYKTVKRSLLIFQFIIEIILSFIICYLLLLVIYFRNNKKIHLT